MQPPEILIVDDEEINLDVLELNLQSFGYDVLRARDGVQAQEILKTEVPALIISDILMPNMDGYQLCREVKTDPLLRSIPLIFYSATYTDDRDREFALSLGAARFVRKPEDPERFASLIAEVLSETGCLEPQSPDPIPLDERTYLSRYNKRLIAKLEDKLNQLDAVNQQLQAEVARSCAAEQTVRQLAYYDGLTGLANRASFLEHAAAVFAEAERRGQRCAVVVLDLDGFWEVNHTLGHRKGSLLLERIGRRIASFDAGPRASLARLGGDEFALLLAEVASDAEVAHTARRLLDSLDSAYDVEGLLVEVTASVGIACFPDHGRDPAAITRHAEVALRAARVSRGLVTFYQPENDPYQPQRLELISSLRRAIREGELELYYQPKLDLEARRVIGAEALMRWHHPSLGLLQPETFITLAEQTGQMRALTSQLIRFALEEMARWHDAGLVLQMCINLSARNLVDDELPDEMSAIMTQLGVDCRSLTLEITESALLRDPARARRVLDRLAAMGATVAVDDFGTGYSSLSHLRVLPVDELKIDKSFVINMADDDNDAMIVRSTIDLAHNLGLKVTAEGVETAAALELLCSLRCDMAQGYLMGRPMPSAEFQVWLRSSPWGLGRAADSH